MIAGGAARLVMAAAPAVVLAACSDDVTVGPTASSGDATTGTGAWATSSTVGVGGAASSVAGATSAMSSSSSSGGDAGAGLGGAGGGRTYTLTEYVGPAIWTSLTRASAIDSSERLFLSDGSTIYVVENGVPSVWLTAAETDSAIPGNGTQIDTMDVGPDDKLYVGHTGAEGVILVSDAPHSIAMAYQHPQLVDVGRLGVESPDRFLVASPATQSILDCTPQGVSVVYSNQDTGTGNGSEDIALSLDGFMFYLPGGGSDPLLGGKTDGSGLGVLSDFDSLNEPQQWAFNGVARDPAGGAVLNVTGTVYHALLDGTMTEVPMSPTLEEMAFTEGDPLAFFFRPIEVGVSGAIYVTSKTTVYKAVP
jgi:hypothetical protein